MKVGKTITETREAYSQRWKTQGKKTIAGGGEVETRNEGWPVEEKGGKTCESGGRKKCQTHESGRWKKGRGSHDDKSGGSHVGEKQIQKRNLSGMTTKALAFVTEWFYGGDAVLWS